LKGQITHLFFDLDHTLWDYDANAAETLKELFEVFQLGSCFTNEDAFIKVFHFINYDLWDQYNNGIIDRDYLRRERFKLVLKGRMDISDAHTWEMSEYFTTHCPRKTRLLPGVLDALTYLHQNYPMYIITNGFEDIQHTKLQSGGIAHFFEDIFTSQTAGYRKPSAEIFRLAEQRSGSTPVGSLMIGDNLLTDIAGAKNAGWKAIWFVADTSSDHNADLAISDMSHLREIL
jgi:putative hydrolase of the HAD superfamily